MFIRFNCFILQWNFLLRYQTSVSSDSLRLPLLRHFYFSFFKIINFIFNQCCTCLCIRAQKKKFFGQRTKTAFLAYLMCSTPTEIIPAEKLVASDLTPHKHIKITLLRYLLKYVDLMVLSLSFFHSKSTQLEHAFLFHRIPCKRTVSITHICILQVYVFVMSKTYFMNCVLRILINCWIFS